MSFSASVYQNEFLPDGATEVNAVVTVTGERRRRPGRRRTEKAVVLIVDTSGSMEVPGTKIRAARRAAATAIELLPDGTLFALVAGTEHGRLRLPARRAAWWRPTPAPGPRGPRRPSTCGPGAARPCRRGSTAPRSCSQPHPEAIRLAYLLTDGINQSETRDDLDGGIARAAGVFQCDTRGVGADWEVAELRHITSALLGEVDIIKEPDQMDDDFQAFLERALGKSVADVRLRMWAPQGLHHPLRPPGGAHRRGPHGQGRRPSTPSPTTSRPAPGRATRAATTTCASTCCRRRWATSGWRPGSASWSATTPVSQGLVRAVWTDDEALSTRINPQVAHYTGQAELAQAIQEGLQARKDGDIDTATVKLGRAVQLAHESGNEGTVKLLRKVVEVDDADTGTVRVKRDVDALDEMELDTRSTRTVRVQKGDPPAPSPTAQEERTSHEHDLPVRDLWVGVGHQRLLRHLRRRHRRPRGAPSAAAVAPWRRRRRPDLTGPAVDADGRVPTAPGRRPAGADRRHVLLLRRAPGSPTTCSARCAASTSSAARCRRRARPHARPASPAAPPGGRARPSPAPRSRTGPRRGGPPSWAPTGPSSTATSPPASSPSPTPSPPGRCPWRATRSRSAAGASPRATSPTSTCRRRSTTPPSPAATPPSNARPTAPGP